MNYNLFKEAVINHMSKNLPDSDRISIETITKNNGTSLDGLVITHPDRNISPTIYLNPYYKRYLEGVDLDEVLNDIETTYRTHLPDENFDMEKILNFDHVKDKIVMKLINYQQNLDFLDNKPYVNYLDLAIIFQYLIPYEPYGMGTITVTYALMEEWETDLDTLYQLAQKNTPLLMPYSANSILDYLSLYTPTDVYKDETLDPMLVLTNTEKLNGATVMLYDNLLKQIADQYDKDLIIIPSSIHEVLLLPVDSIDEESLDYYTSVVKEVNFYELSEDEVLSSHVYTYNRLSNCVS